MTDIRSTDTPTTSQIIHDDPSNHPTITTWQSIDLQQDDRIEQASSHSTSSPPPRLVPLPPPTFHQETQSSLLDQVREQLRSLQQNDNRIYHRNFPSISNEQIEHLQHYYHTCMHQADYPKSSDIQIPWQNYSKQVWANWLKLCHIYDFDAFSETMFECWCSTPLAGLRDNNQIFQREYQTLLAHLNMKEKLAAIRSWLQCPSALQYILKRHPAQHWQLIASRIEHYPHLQLTDKKILLAFSCEQWQQIQELYHTENIENIFTTLTPLIRKIQNLRQQHIIEQIILNANNQQLDLLQQYWQDYFKFIEIPHQLFSVLESLLRYPVPDWDLILSIADDIASENGQMNFVQPLQILLTTNQHDWILLQQFYKTICTHFQHDNDYQLLRICAKIPPEEQETFTLIALSYERHEQLTFDIYAQFLEELSSTTAPERINIHQFLFQQQLEFRHESQNSLSSVASQNNHQDLLEQLTEENVMDEQKISQMHHMIQVLWEQQEESRSHWHSTLALFEQTIHQKLEEMEPDESSNRQRHLLQQAYCALHNQHIEDLSPPFAHNPMICTISGQSIGTAQTLHLVYTTAIKQIESIEDTTLKEQTRKNLEHSLYVALASCIEDQKRICATGVGQRLVSVLAGYIQGIEAIDSVRPEEVLTIIGYSWHHHHPNAQFSRAEGEHFLQHAVETIKTHFLDWNEQRKRSFADQLRNYLALTFTEEIWPSTQDIVAQINQT